MPEIWRNVPDLPNYQVSNLGNVRGKNGRLLTQHPASNGAMKVNLGSTSRLVHRLIEAAFTDTKVDRCSKGHELEGDNVIQWGSRNRICVACRKGEPAVRVLPERL
jgi:hypothetical protein